MGDGHRAPTSPGCAHQHLPAGPPVHPVTVRWLPAPGLPSRPKAGVPEARPTVRASRADPNLMPNLMPTRCPSLPLPSLPHHPLSTRPGPAPASPPWGPAGRPSLETTASWPTASGEQKDPADGKTRAGAEMGAVSGPHGEVTQVRADAMRHLGREGQQGGHTASEGLPDLM